MLYYSLFQTLLVVLGIILLVCVTNPVVFAWAAPIIIAFFILRRYYIKTTREVKRIEGLSKFIFFLYHLFHSVRGFAISSEIIKNGNQFVSNMCRFCGISGHDTYQVVLLEINT